MRSMAMRPEELSLLMRVETKKRRTTNGRNELRRTLVCVRVCPCRT